jgi:hypothetical protein
MDIHVSDLIRWPVTVYGWVDKRMIEEQHAFLGFAIPAPGVVLVGSAEVGMRTKVRQEGGFVVRRAAHPTIREAGPGCNRVTRPDQILGTARGAEIFVGVSARTRIRSAGQDVVGSGVVQRIVQPGDHARGVAEGRVGGHVFDPFAVDPDLASVTQAL